MKCQVLFSQKNEMSAGILPSVLSLPSAFSITQKKYEVYFS